MKVRELIEKLEALDQDLEVRRADSMHEPQDLSSVAVEKMWFGCPPGVVLR